MKLGTFSIDLIPGGNFKLDGGAMFGVVPKPLWRRTNPSDKMNRITLAANCYLIRTGEKNILIDTGNGTKFSSKKADIFCLDKSVTLTSSLKKTGILPEMIDIVILSHLHFDHAGGATILDTQGAVVPTFPNAKYIIQKGELEDAINNYGVMKGTYEEDNYMPVVTQGMANLITGDYKVCEGVKTIITGGHTRFHQGVLIESEGETAAYLGDLIPTSSHLKGAYSMSYDLMPLVIKKQKIALLKKASMEGWIILFDHDPKMPVCTIKKEKNDTFSANRITG